MRVILDAKDIKAIKLKWEHEAIKKIRALTKEDVQSMVDGDTLQMTFDIDVMPSWSAYLESIHG